jgi:tetratricopeptide (TPR) repeat protein
VRLGQGHPDLAGTLVRQALALCEGTERRALASSFEVTLGVVEEARGAVDSAVACYERALDLKTSLPSVPESAHLAWALLAGALATQGRVEEARAALARSTSERPIWDVIRRVSEARVALAEARPDRAGERAAFARAQYEQVSALVRETSVGNQSPHLRYLIERLRADIDPPAG